MEANYPKMKTPGAPQSTVHAALTEDEAGALKTHPVLEAALGYWMQKQGGGGMPLCEDVDILDLPLEILPWVIFTEVLRDPLDFRYTYMGASIVQMCRRDLTGCRLSALPQTGRNSVLWAQRAALVAARRPTFAVPPYTGPDVSVRKVRNIHMPLTRTGTEVDVIFTAVAFEQM